MRKRGLCHGPVSVRPSVRPSRWFIVSTSMKISSNFFVGQVASAPVPNSKGNPFSGAHKGVGKFCDFRLKSPSISETVQNRPMIAMKR